MTQNKTGTFMEEAFAEVESEFLEGMGLQKCWQCGCMREELEQAFALPQTPDRLRQKTEHWLREMDPIRYACLGCEHCYPAVAAGILSDALPHQIRGPACSLEPNRLQWPPVAGEYFVLDPASPVAVSTLGSAETAQRIAEAHVPGVSIVGKTETENIGIDKIIKNTITNPAIRILILVGPDPPGHLPGATLLALLENGMDQKKRVIDSPGRRPFLRNVTAGEVETFRKQLQIVDRIGLSNLEEITEVVAEESSKVSLQAPCGSQSCECIEPTQVVQAESPQEIEMDRAGYFVILLDRGAGQILVEHYSYDDRLQRVIKGSDARSIYWTMINNSWVSQLSHAAYLGKELARAELSIHHDLPYIQDGA